MDVVAFLLRLVLCLCLAVGGVGPVHAGTHPSSGASTAAEASMAHAPAGAGGCHESDPSQADQPAAAQAIGGAADPGTMDCCDGGMCACGCPAPASMAHAEGAPGDAGWRPRDVTRHGASARAAPRLPHLMRPPIG